MINFPQPYTVIFDWSEKYQMDHYNESFPDREAPVYQVWASDPDEAADRGEECAVEEFGRMEFNELRAVRILIGHAYGIGDD